MHSQQLHADWQLGLGAWWRVGWRNADYARLVERARRLTDQSERMALYGQAERILVQEAAIVPLFYGRRHRLTQPWISEPPPLAIGGPRWKDLMIQPHS